MKLELKHLVPYLPYNLKVDFLRRNFIKKDRKLFGCVFGYNDRSNEHYLTKERVTYAIEDVQPHLRPIEDLEKEIWVKGKKIIVADIIFPKEDYKKEFDRKVEIEALKLQNAINHSCTYYAAMEILFQYHFDVFGLIKAGLAVNINTLP